MANIPLDRLYFGLEDRENPAAGAVRRYKGVISCRRNVGAFFDIEDKSLIGDLFTERTGGTRSLVLVGGATLAGTGAYADALVPWNYRNQGSKTIKLVTGARTAATAPRRGYWYKTVSFRAPGFLSVVEISDVLGSIIPASKMKATPTAADIFPYFILPTGVRHSIMSVSEATSREDTFASTDLAAIRTRLNLTYYVPAGI